ncbi:MAG TPA: hypothetical protein VGR45_02125, partial [Stellaceae bacterium]|nr:hypothetical protein [Stellaceae bacterium]
MPDGKFETWLKFINWSEKRVVSQVEYDRMKAAGELDPMGVYCIHNGEPERGLTSREMLSMW